MLLRILFLVLLVVMGGEVGAQTGKLSGRVTETSSKAPIPDVNVVVKLKGKLKGFATTDEKGHYSVGPLVPGNYSVQFINMVFKASKVTKVVVKRDKTAFLNMEMSEYVMSYSDYPLTMDHRLRLVEPDHKPAVQNVYQLKEPGTRILRGEQIRRMPVR